MGRESENVQHQDDQQDDQQVDQQGQGGQGDRQADQQVVAGDVQTLQQQIEALQAEITRRDARIKELNNESAGRRVENKTLAQQVEEVRQMLQQEVERRENAERQAQQAAKQAERQKQIARLAEQYHLPAALADRLRGETPDELESDAKALAGSLQTNSGGTGSGGGRTSAGSSAWQGGLTLEQIRAMSPAEIAARMDEVDAALTALQRK